MSLKAGTHLGSYEVLAPIGAGGMGEVYQAHDTKLGRDVAIKVLPEAFALDPGRLSRFQREAKMLASLNHPHIAMIHGLEQSNGVHYLVMELVPGETLRERVAREGPLPVEEALGICRQITEALETAHDKGIIHRDLKPANVKVTPEGKVKILDFGLAKALAGDAATSDPATSPTLSAAATLQGVILGTAAYMSPEQARGKAVDKRTDIWALGCVLYELLTAKQAFQGETVTEILAAVLKGEPEWQALPANTPPTIRVLLRRCLQKDVNRRVRDAGDVRIEIEEALAAPLPTGSTVAQVPERTVWRWALVAGLVCLIIGAVVTGVVVWNLKPAATVPPVTRMVITLPPGQQLAGLDGGPAVALSPDGSQLAYVARQNGTQQIYLRAMDGLESKPIPGTEDGVVPFFSPDGQWLGFFAGAKLKKISVSGGPALILGDAPFPMGASWGGQGIIAFTPVGGASPLLQLPDAGGPTQLLTHLTKGDAAHRWPEFLPGGRAVLFAAGTNGISFGNARIAAQSIGTHEQRNLIQGGTDPRYAPSGHLIYAQGGNLMAAAFDVQRLRTMGAPVPVAQGVLQSPVSGAAQYSLSATGSLVYVSGGIQSAQRRLVWVNRDGAEQPSAAPGHAYLGPRLSPDGGRIALATTDQDAQVWVYDLSRQTLTRFTFEGSFNANPVWTPDGKRIAFLSNREGSQNIFWQLADGSGGLERLTTSDYLHAPASWSPDGQLLAFFEVNLTTQRDIWVLRMSDRKMQPFLRTPFDEAVPRFSPDGRWLAYISNESGRYEIYVQPYPGPGGKWQISAEGGTEPVWNRNGRELFYRNGNKMMVVDISTQPGFAAGAPRVVFEGRYELAPFPISNYDVSPDGQRFLMLKPVEQEQAAPTQINVVLNWFEELKRRVPK
jgi:eukaryotic-like serine/threonine-protein kinase